VGDVVRIASDRRETVDQLTAAVRPRRLVAGADVDEGDAAAARDREAADGHAQLRAVFEERLVRHPVLLGGLREENAGRDRELAVFDRMDLEFADAHYASSLTPGLRALVMRVRNARGSAVKAASTPSVARSMFSAASSRRSMRPNNCFMPPVRLSTSSTIPLSRSTTFARPASTSLVFFSSW